MSRDVLVQVQGKLSEYFPPGYKKGLKRNLEIQLGKYDVIANGKE